MIRTVMEGAAAGVAQMHKLNFVHGDIKPDNCFLKREKEPIREKYCITELRLDSDSEADEDELFSDEGLYRDGTLCLIG